MRVREVCGLLAGSWVWSLRSGLWGGWGDGRLRDGGRHRGLESMDSFPLFLAFDSWHMHTTVRATRRFINWRG